MLMAALKFNNQKGQSLIELLVALGIAGIFIVGMTTAIEVSLKTGSQNEFIQSASLLAQEELDSLVAASKNDWHKIGLVVPNDNLSPLLEYFVDTSVQPFTISAAGLHESKIVGNVTYDRYFVPEAVYRNNNGEIGSGAGYNLDPATIKATAHVSWGNVSNKISLTRYINRVGNYIFKQTDWSAGVTTDQLFIGKETIFSSMSPLDGIDYSGEVGAITVKTAGSGGGVSGSIDSTNPKHYAWNDIIGWIDFAPVGNPCGASGNVIVSDLAMTGCASSNVGAIVLDCAHSPGSALNCADPLYQNWKVSNINGNLSGYAWNDNIGWINFDYSQSGVAYRVRIQNGNFEGYAWNDAIGWISFNCNHINPASANSPAASCASSGGIDYLVRTNWNVPANSSAELVSSIFDTSITSGALLNSIMWLGDQPTNTSVQLWVASSNNQNGPWNYTGPYNVIPSYAAALNIEDHYNKQYFRYKVNLQTDGAGISPKATDVIINWTP